MDGKHNLLLLIEDNPLLTGMYKTAFEAAGFDVVFVHDGESGVKMAKEKMPKVILLDLLMPGIDGFEVMKRIKSDPATKDIKIIVLTVLNKDDIKQKATEAGADDFLIKADLKLSEIVNKVVSHLN